MRFQLQHGDNCRSIIDYYNIIVTEPLDILYYILVCVHGDIAICAVMCDDMILYVCGYILVLCTVYAMKL